MALLRTSPPLTLIHLSQSALNTLLWSGSLLLQIGLVVALFRRGIPRHLPAFTALAIFYPVRAALLFLLYGHIAPDTYGSLNAASALIDLLLQAAVIVEVTRQLIRERAGWTLPRALTALGLLLTCSVLTSLLLHQLPAHAPIPVDRAQTFIWFLWIALFVCTLCASSSGLLRRTMFGLALYAAVSLAAQAGRTAAAFQRNAQSYARWSYTSAIAYLIIVVLWLVTLRKPVPQSPADDASALV